MKNVALDAHKRYSLGSIENAENRALAERRIPHRRGEIREFLAGLEPGTPVAPARVRAAGGADRRPTASGPSTGSYTAPADRRRPRF